MRTQSLVVPAVVLPVVFLSTTLFAPHRICLQAQRPVSPPVASPSPAPPADVQTRLEKLQAGLEAAQKDGNAASQIKTLNALGDLHFIVGAYSAAMDEYTRALTTARKLNDPAAQATALVGQGNCYRSQGEYDKALAAFQQALDVATPSNDLGGEASALIGIGWVDQLRGEFQKSLEVEEKALQDAQTANDESLEASALRRLGSAYLALNQLPKATVLNDQSLSICRRIGDVDGEGRTLLNIGKTYQVARDAQKAVDYYNQALSRFNMAGDRAGEGLVLFNIASSHYYLGDWQEALDSYNQAALIFHGMGDLLDEANANSFVGNILREKGDPEKALGHLQKALDLFRQLGNRNGEAAALNDTGLAYDILGDRQKALDNYDQAALIFHEISDSLDETKAIGNAGNILREKGDLNGALDYYEKALSDYRQLGNRDGEGMMLANIGTVAWEQGQLAKAMSFYNQALPIFHEIGDQDSETWTLNNLGFVHYDLGDKDKALELFSNAVAAARKSGDRSAEAWALTNLGMAKNDLGNSDQAWTDLNQALAISQKIGDRESEAITLGDMGEISLDRGRPEQATDSAGQAVTLFHTLGSPEQEAESERILGDGYRGQLQWKKAADAHFHALSLAVPVGDLPVEAMIYHSLMLDLRAEQPALAAFYGKQAVNLLQQVRSNIETLDRNLQRKFLNSKDDHYHDLADLLIDQGRLPEAQQVLDLLKQQEYSDYVRGDTANPLNPLSLTPAEQQAADDYAKSTNQIVSLGEQWSALKKISSRTPEQEQQYQQLSVQLDAASKGLNDYYARLYSLFGSSTSANKQVADVKGDVSVLRQALARMPHTVALYTLVGSQHLSVIVVTGSTAVAREYPITEKDLNQKVAAFQQLLRDPHSDPRPLALELYNILLVPIKADLDQAHAETLVWSLDGVLRYVPIAALYDGNRYLVEHYNTVTITPASIPHLGEKPDFANLSAAAMGISRQFENALPALPSVVAELDQVVNDPQAQNAHGVLPGTLLLNGAFTQKAMEHLLGSPRTVVHIASHFVFSPGDDNQSYLLLAGRDKDASGYHLTVADFRDDPQLSLDNTDLLTLSACETGMSGNAGNGREVDGLGTTAQLKGARAVISSLWEVNDASTGEMMADFYRRWADGAGKVMKVEALRQAQLDLLLGKSQPQAGASGRGVTIAASEETTSSNFAHPYYWAPFVLMGNWR